jgi:hypothetical protein
MKLNKLNSQISSLDIGRIKAFIISIKLSCHGKSSPVIYFKLGMIRILTKSKRLYIYA